MAGEAHLGPSQRWLSFSCSSRSQWLRLESAEGLLDSRVWHLAQVAGTAEAGQSSFLVARLSFLWDGWLPHIASTPKDRRWKLCFSYRKWLSVTSATFYWLKQSLSLLRFKGREHTIFQWEHCQKICGRLQSAVMMD